jgi:hypothetical protein
VPYIKLAESQKIGKPNNLKVFGNKKTKGLQHDGQKQQNNHDPSWVWSGLWCLTPPSTICQLY